MLSRKTDLHRKDLRSLEGHKDIKMPITNMYMVSSKRIIKAAKVLEISSSKYSFRMSIIISYGLPFNLSLLQFVLLTCGTNRT